MKSGMLALMTILGSADALLVQGSGATRPSVRSNTATQSGKAAAALTSAVAAFASAPAAMAAMDSGADLGSIQSFAVELDAITTAVGLPVEQIGIAVAGVVVVGGGGYYLQQQGEEKAQAKRDAEDARRTAEFQAMKKNDNNAGIFAMGIPAAISVGYFVWLVTNFS